MGQHVLLMIDIIVLAALVVAAAVVAVARRGRSPVRPAGPAHRPAPVRPVGVTTPGTVPAQAPRRTAPEPTAVFADQIQARVIVMDPHDPDWRAGYVQGVRIDGPRVTAIGNHIDDGSPWTMSVPANRPFVVHIPVAAGPPTQQTTRAAELTTVR